MNRHAALMALMAGLLAALSLFGLGYAVAELAGGVREVSQHWWSVLPLMGLFLSALTALAAYRLSKIRPLRRT